MNIDSIKNGIVIDHIKAGKGMEIYNLLELDKLDCSIAIIKNVMSRKLGKKDIIKIDSDFDVDLDVLGYIDPGVTIDVIKDGVLVEKKKVELPAQLKNVIKCKNPGCITSIEQELPHIFVLADEAKEIYRCKYCEEKYRESSKQ